MIGHWTNRILLMEAVITQPPQMAGVKYAEAWGRAEKEALLPMP